MVNITIFNDYLHTKTSDDVKLIYPEGMHNALKQNLAENDFNIRTATLDDPECGLSEEVINSTDVLLWWGHMRHEKVPDEVAVRVQKAVLNGMGIIFLHSAHMSKPFRLLMGTSCALSWRENGDREYVWVCDPSHPIARGVPRYIKLDHEETYSEPFGIPEPDKLVFIGNYEGGEVFRSGCCYKRGYGNIFYFQPGHESFPTFHNPLIIKVIKNAIRWAVPTYKADAFDCPHIIKIKD